MVMASKRNNFSLGWVIVSMITFILVELIVGGLIGKYIVGRYMSLALSFTMQGLLNIISYFIGGFIIGVISPKVRIIEPAVGAFFSIFLMFMLTFFVPQILFQYDLTKIIIGGSIAFVLALIGAACGEIITKQV